MTGNVLVNVILNMTRVWLALGCSMFLLQPRAVAQVTIGPSGPVAAKNVEERANEWQRRILSVSPAAEPQPALRYSFQFRSGETTPGDAVPFYYRAFAEMAARSRDDVIRLQNLVDVPYDRLLQEDAGDFLRKYDSVIAQLTVAVRREECRWSLHLQRDLDVLQIARQTWPELSSARDIARLLVVKTRWQVGQKDFAGAIHSLRLGYQMAADLGHTRTAIGGLVGVAITAMLNNALLHLIDASGSPNVYWAVAELPRPLIDLRSAWETELDQIPLFAPEVYAAEVSQQSIDHWRDALWRLEELLPAYGQTLPEMPRGTAVTGMALLGYSRAKRLLLDQGYTVEQIEAMPVGEVIARHQTHANRTAVDEIRKWAMIPYHLGWKRVEDAQREFVGKYMFLGASERAEVLPVMTVFSPTLSAMKVSQVLMETNFCAIQAIEAIRMHAATNQGAAPESLDQVTVVPVPRNPANDQPFLYQKTTAGFELRTDALGLPESYWRRFVVTLER